jgi:hypothetical protein
MTSGPQMWVQTSYFKVEPGEDRETNPGRYGRAFANWLAEKLRTYGEPVEEVFGEDWGWCVMVARQPYMLWVGCANRAERTDEWGAFVQAEPSFLQRLFGRIDDRPVVARLSRVLSKIMQEVPNATKVWSEDSLQSTA